MFILHTKKTDGNYPFWLFWFIVVELIICEKIYFDLLDVRI